MVVIVFSAAVFMALILYIALEQDKRERLTGIAFFIATAGGILIYGFSYATEGHSFFEDSSGVFKTLVDVGRMFVGMNNEPVYRAMLEDEGLSGGVWSLLFWVTHFLAYYSMASAAILTLGKGAARKLQLWLLNIRDVDLIYGITDNAIALGRHIATDPHLSVVFVGQATAAQELAIRQMKALLLSDDMATVPQEGFLDCISVKEKKGRLKLYAISKEGEANYNYALRLLRLLEKRKIPVKNTSLVLLGREERHGNVLQAYSDHYGYGEVQVFDGAELTSRLLIQRYPLCSAIDFDPKGRAEQNMEVLLVGFGHSGQEILRKIVANGQFEGSRFHVDVFDPEYGRHDGFYQKRYAAMLENYDICFHANGGRSREFCAFLEEHAKRLKYIVISIGDLGKCRELAEEIMELMIKTGRKLPVYACCDSSVVRYHPQDESVTHNLHDMETLFGADMDRQAMEINHFYHDPAGSLTEQWQEADYFSRMSCRASADFLGSYLPRVLQDETEEPDKEMLENLAKTEHLRWNAFHYSMGYSCMEKEEWDERAAKFREQEEKGISPRIRISKDPENHRHACLVDWDELDALSRKENAVTGGHVDYKQMDRDNVVTMAKLLRGNGSDKEEGNA
ncbi:MAG: hypothetical protein K6E50_07580 [Lachnospiraceae bacterium]|nr:hypothetical protein [Lachnospiraceae bacterium]